MAFKKITTSLVVLVFMWLMGCASVKDTKPQFGLENINDQTMATRFESERAYLKGKVPKIGLALSGGGTKAAIFAHGVLHGLHDGGLLDQVDAISSVSGGGYAAFWYYSKLMEAQSQGYSKDAIFQDCFPSWWDNIKPDDKNPDNQKLKKAFDAGRASAKLNGQAICDHPSHTKIGIEGDPFRWQAHLLRWPDLLRTQITTVNGDAQSSPKADIFSQTLSVLFELTIGWTGIESNLPRSYQYGIERTWGLNPAPRNTKDAQTLTEGQIWTYTNALTRDESNTALRVDPAKMTWQGLKNLYMTNDPPPLWILNTMEGDKGDRPDLGNLYELTPFGHGSAKRGYKTEAPPLDSIAQGVRASAAYADSQGLSNEDERIWVNSIAALIPAARWGVRVKLEDKDGEKIKVRLSDGGGADNLGLISLVRRGLTDIIVVDGAGDGQGLMDDLCWAKVALQQEGLKMSFPTFDRFNELCSIRYPEKESADTSRYLAYNVSDWLNPVVQGVVEWEGTGRKTNIWLIKAAWNQIDVRQAYNKSECGNTPNDINCFLLLYYGHNTNSKVSKAENDFTVFPQHATASTTLNSSSYLTLAYRELGRMMAARLELGPDQKIKIKEDRMCLQPAYEATRKGRPGPTLTELNTKPTSCTPVASQQ